MSFVREEDTRVQALQEVARKMLIAARTAPKGRGIDTLTLGMVGHSNIEKVANKMRAIGNACGMNAFLRDADNLEQVEVMVILGSKIQTLGLKKCGMCGFANCDEKTKHPNVPCVFNSGDLGIAVGSAAAVAMDARVDNRIMYTAGQAVMELGLLGDEVRICYCIPLSSTGKNIFFDRKKPQTTK